MKQGWCPYKKRQRTQGCAQRNGHVGTQQEGKVATGKPERPQEKANLPTP